MNEYAKRTCSNCGLKLPQPQMNQRVVSLQVARGKRGLSNRELVGTLVGSKKARNSLLGWLFAPNVRNYTRKQKIWLCDECDGGNRRQSGGWFVLLPKFWIWFLTLTFVGQSLNLDDTTVYNDIMVAAFMTHLYYLAVLLIRPQNRNTFISFAYHYCSAIVSLFLCLVHNSFVYIWIIPFSVINLFLLHRLSRSASEEEV